MPAPRAHPSGERRASAHCPSRRNPTVCRVRSVEKSPADYRTQTKGSDVDRFEIFAQLFEAEFQRRANGIAADVQTPLIGLHFGDNRVMVADKEAIIGVNGSSK